MNTLNSADALNKTSNMGQRLIYLVSQPRSGSTLLQRVLGAHTDVHTVAEPWVMLHPMYALKEGGIHTEYGAEYARAGVDDFIATLPNGRADYIEGIRAMASTWYSKALEGQNKTYFLDKTPRYYNIIPELQEVFVDAKVILLLRNPLSVLSSVLQTWVGKNWARLQLHRDDLLRAPMLIVNAMEALGDRVIVFRYEQFVQSPRLEIEKLCDSLGIPYEAEMLNYGNVPAPKGRMGDSKGIHQFSRPENVNLDKWKKTFTYPTYRLLAQIVLTIMGRDVLAKMGFSFDALYNALMQIPLDPFRISREEIVAMVSALRLTPEQVTGITPLIQPYLIKEKHLDAV